MKFNLITSFRSQEYKVFLYRMGLVFLFYQLSRLLFYLYNRDLIPVETLGEIRGIFLYGLLFDASAIVYTNLVFILLSFIPLLINTSKLYQRILFWVYAISNLTAYATNFIDFAYYRYTYTRATTAVLESIKHEKNKVILLKLFLLDYWHIFLLFFICVVLWVKLYKRISLSPKTYQNKKIYFVSSILMLVFITFISVIGARGGLILNSRPINLVDASRFSKKAGLSDLILNTPFAIIRTINKNYFKKINIIPNNVVDSVIHPIKAYKRKISESPNVVIFILESFSREYIGAFKENRKLPNYKSYTPFLDSLADHSLIFSNAYANGRKSIHAMSSVLAGIPSFKVAYVSSPYAKLKTNSVVSIANEMGYDTSFFHGAYNGSMGFLGYSNILGFNHYYGKTEYNNDDDFDGHWGIPDKPFLKFTGSILEKKQQPFMATVFTLSSHHPYLLPKKEIGKYPLGDIPIHKCVAYTDDSLKQFFKKASKSPWFHNTIFVFVADHTNQIYYETYRKRINRFAIPIILYSPNPKLIGRKGEDNSLAGQIDIFPTLADLMGYNKPIRSWGRSLMRNNAEVKPYAMISDGSLFFFLQDSLIHKMDYSMKTMAFYNIQDKALTQDLKHLTKETKSEIEIRAKSLIQDYMNRIIENKLYIKDTH